MRRDGVLSGVQDGLGDCARPDGGDVDAQRHHIDKGIFSTYQNRSIALHQDLKSLSDLGKPVGKAVARKK